MQDITLKMTLNPRQILAMQTIVALALEHDFTRPSLRPLGGEVAAVARGITAALDAATAPHA